MAGDPIDIANAPFHIASHIEQCPKRMMLRELVMNAIEAATQDKSGMGYVRIGATTIKECGDTPKLYVWNNGPGMNSYELNAICRISFSLNKTQSMDGNFGIGAKVATLPSNQLGVRYRSKRQGKVSQVILYKDDETGYSRYPYYVNGVKTNVIDVTAVVEAENNPNYSRSEEWTEVVLLGNESHQNTVVDPHNDGEEQRQWVPKRLFHRFWRIPKNVEIKLEEAVNTKHSDRIFRTISSTLDSFTRYEEVITNNGIIIYYMHDHIKDTTGKSNKTQSYNSHSCYFNTSICVIYKGEMYNVLEGNLWWRIAAAFGITYGPKNFSIAIELPDDFPVRPEQYREEVRYLLGKQKRVEVEDFCKIVLDNRPSWLIDAINSYSTSSESCEDIEKLLQSILNETLLREKTNRLNDKGDVTVREDDEIVNVSRRRKRTATASDTPKPNKNLVFDPDGALLAESSIMMERAPKIEFITNEEEEENHEVSGKAGVYYAPSNTLFVNLLYPEVEKAYNDFSDRYKFHPDFELVHKECQNSAHKIIVEQVGFAVVYAKIKKLQTESWSESDIEKAWSKESLSIAADSWQRFAAPYYAKLSKMFKSASEVSEAA